MRLLLLLCLLLAGPVSAAPALQGTWSAVVDGNPLTVVFGAGGGGAVDGQPMHWQVMGQMLFVEVQGEVATYQFETTGDALAVSGGDFAGVVTFTRGAAGARKASSAAPATGSASQTAARQADARQTGAGSGPELVGKWCKGGSFSANAGGGSSSMTCFELKADGSYSYEHEGSISAYAPGMWGGTASSSADSGHWRLDGKHLVAQSRGGSTTRYLLEKRNHPRNRDPMLCLDGDCYTTYWQKRPW